MVQLNAEKGIPVARPVFFCYDEPEAYTESTEYLLGGDLLVAPILRQGAKGRTVWLPKDRWVNLWTGREYSCGTYKVGAPFGYPPVFYRRDSEYSKLFEEFKEQRQ